MTQAKIVGSHAAEAPHEPAMAKRDDHHEYIELGRKNASLITRLRPWCRHLDVKVEISGLLAQMTRLPIGMLQVTCPHGVTQGMSMHLEHEAEQFITQNCISCPHHKELSSDNLGRDILANREKAKVEADVAQQRRRELERQIQAEVANALQTKEMTQASVNRLILNLHDPQASQEALTNLQEAAKIAPEFFSEEAIRVIGDNVRTQMGATCVDIIRTVLLARRELPPFIPKIVVAAAAARCENACHIVVDHFSNFEPALRLDVLACAVTIPEYEHIPGAIYARPKFPGVIRLVEHMLGEAPEDVRSLFERRLTVDNKHVKFNCARLLIDLLPAGARHIIPLTRMLVRSLELTDDAYGESADEAVCEVLAHLYVFAPAHVTDESSVYTLSLAAKSGFSFSTYMQTSLSWPPSEAIRGTHGF